MEETTNNHKREGWTAVHFKQHLLCLNCYRKAPVVFCLATDETPLLLYVLMLACDLPYAVFSLHVRVGG